MFTCLQTEDKRLEQAVLLTKKELCVMTKIINKRINT